MQRGAYLGYKGVGLEEEGEGLADTTCVGNASDVFERV